MPLLNMADFSEIQRKTQKIFFSHVRKIESLMRIFQKSGTQKGTRRSHAIQTQNYDILFLKKNSRKWRKIFFRSSNWTAYSLKKKEKTKRKITESECVFAKNFLHKNQPRRLVFSSLSLFFSSCKYYFDQQIFNVLNLKKIPKLFHKMAE